MLDPTAFTPAIKALTQSSDRLAEEVREGRMSEEDGWDAMDTINAELGRLRRLQHEAQVADDLLLAQRLRERDELDMDLALQLWATLERTGFNLILFAEAVKLSPEDAREVYDVGMQTYDENVRLYGDEFLDRLQEVPR